MTLKRLLHGQQEELHGLIHGRENDTVPCHIPLFLNTALECGQIKAEAATRAKERFILP